MAWVPAVATVAGGLFGKSGGKSAANAETQASQAAIGEQRRQFDTLLSLTAPQRAIGNQALATLGGIYGYSPTAGQNELAAPTGINGDGSYQPNQGGIPAGFGGNGIYRGIFDQMRTNQMQIPSQPRAPVTIDNATGQVSPANYESFFASPDYKFRFQQGQQGVQNTAAAQGGLYSGNALRALTDYGQGMGASEFGNWFNRQAALAGIGQTATSQAGQGALQTGANVGNLLVGQGNARASGIIDQTNSITNMVNELAKIWGSRKPPALPDGGWM